MTSRWPQNSDRLAPEGLNAGTANDAEPASNGNRVDALPPSQTSDPTHPTDDTAVLTKNERRCIVTREIRPKAELLRFVLSPNREVVMDVDQRLPGRGAYCTPARALVETAVAKGHFARAFKGKVTVSDGWLDAMVAGLERRVDQRLGLIAKARQLATGAEIVSAGLIGPTLPKSSKLLLSAEDAAVNGSERLHARAFATNTPVVRVANKDRLSNALGRPNVAHVSILDRHQALALVKIINLVKSLSEDATWSTDNTTAPASGPQG